MPLDLLLLGFTGTGSSAWHFNMSCVCKEQTKAVAEEVMKQFPHLMGEKEGLFRYLDVECCIYNYAFV